MILAIQFGVVQMMEWNSEAPSADVPTPVLMTLMDSIDA